MVNPLLFLMPESQRIIGKRFIENMDFRGLVLWWYWRLPLKGISIIKFHWLYWSYLTLYRGNPYFLHKIIFQVFPKPTPALQPHTCCVVCLYFVFPFSTSYVLLNSFLLQYAYCLIQIILNYLVLPHYWVALFSISRP